MYFIATSDVNVFYTVESILFFGLIHFKNYFFLNLKSSYFFRKVFSFQAFQICFVFILFNFLCLFFITFSYFASMNGLILFRLFFWFVALIKKDFSLDFDIVDIITL